MKASVMFCICRYCRFGKSLRYADGHYSIKCVHPENDPRTTRDVTILDHCPIGKEPKNT